VTDARPERASTIDRVTLEVEVTRIIRAASDAGLTVRVVGSIAVAMHCPDAAAILPSFDRTYADIDLVAYRRDSENLAVVFAELGYRNDRETFVASEGARSILEDPIRGLHIDVFYDRLEFCHTIPLVDRLEADAPTIPLAELVLSKLQIVKINEKDVIDLILLLLDHPVGSGDRDTIDVDRIASLCADDWGLWRTLSMNLAKVASFATSYPQLADGQRTRVRDAVVAINRRIDAEPKPLTWRMRDRVGDRRQWWTDVDEVR
jgi:hypothetical protein